MTKIRKSVILEESTVAGIYKVISSRIENGDLNVNFSRTCNEILEKGLQK